MEKEKQEIKEHKKTVREEFAEKFISLLSSETPLSWTKGWVDSGVPHRPYNGASGHEYSGINRLILMFDAAEKGYSDPRYFTFKQANGKGYKVLPGEKAIRVEYWAVWDKVQKKSLSISEAKSLLKTGPDRKQEEFQLYSKASYVFNAQQLSGIELMKQPELPNAFVADHLAEEVFKTMTENMELPIRYGGNQAYYNPATDSIALPRKEAFYSTSEYYGTLTHEMCHATGHPSRLNRPLIGFQQDKEAYAAEELRAEIASTILCAELGISMPPQVEKNHLAYVQSWLSAIKKDNNVLFSAIKDADKIVDYCMEKGRVELIKEQLTVKASMPAELMEGTSYEIWQLKDDPMNNAIAFMPYDYAKEFRLTESRYDKVYESPVSRDDNSLEKIFVKYNMNRPADFRGHSLSASDVVVTKNEKGEKRAWYCDSIGFREIQDFGQKLHQAESYRRAV